MHRSQPTVTKAELRGWYGYGFASEPYSVVAMSVFLPIILESLAASNGYQLDRRTPCDVSQPHYKCVMRVVGDWYIDTSSFPLYVSSLAVALQALIFVSCGALADHGNWKKTLLLLFSVVGAASGLLLLGVTGPHLWWLAAISTIIGSICFGASYVFYYAYIPTLTRYHPQVLEAERSKDPQVILKITEKISNGISSHGMALGYMAGVALLIVCAGIVAASEKDMVLYSMQIGCGLSSLWWLIFSYIPYRNLQSRPGPPLPPGESYIWYSWKQVGRTITSIRQLNQAFRFLLSWFLLSDGISTIVTVAILFGKTALKMPDTQLVIAAIVVPLAALTGTYFWLYAQRRLGLSTRQMSMLLTGLYSLLPLYGLCGFFADFGLKHPSEVWIVCVYHGLMLGAIQSFCRVLFSELLPVGKESEFFSLYEITDKGSAWIGPLVTGAISDATHDLRYSFIFLLAMLILPLLLIWSLDVDQGRKDAAAYALADKQKRLV